MDYKSMNDVLELAIEREQNAADFYTSLAKNAKTETMRKTFAEFANEEKGHKARLIKIKDTGEYDLKDDEVVNLKLGDYLMPVQPSENISYQDALIIAMKREKAAYSLYMKLSQNAPNEKLKKVFVDLANEEAKHKLRFETEYDDVVYKEN